MPRETRPRRRLHAVIAVLLGAAVFGVAGAEPTPSVTAFTGVDVVDVRAGRIVPDRTLLIADGRIVAVRGASVPMERGTAVVPMDGAFVIPGLWDMHVHIADGAYLDHFASSGVTGVRDMGGGLDRAGDGCESLAPGQLRRWRAEVMAGRRVGPEIVIAGRAVSGTGWPTSLAARTPAEAEAAVDALARQDVDFIKVYEKIPLPAFRALATSARRRGLPFAGHVPEDVGPLRAIRAGQRSIEHLRDALLVCFSADKATVERFFAEDRWGNADRAWGRSAHAACPQIFAALKSGETWVTPTLTVEKAKVAIEDPAHLDDPRRRLLPASVRAGFIDYAEQKLAQSREERASERLWWLTQQKLVRRLNANGVKLLAGTDSACQGGLPGHSLHGELAELVAAGLSPGEALRTATIEPARYLRRSREGEVAAGFTANLVFLEANPLTDIANSRRIRAVVLRGELLDIAPRRLAEPPRGM